MTKFSRIHFSSKSGKWNTPKEVFDGLHKEFHFSFDPCLPPIIGKFKGNGLKEKWKGRVFCNPPYDNISQWIKTGWEEICQNNCQLIVFLIPSRTGTKWFSFLQKRDAEFRRCTKRLKFGDAKQSAPFDSLIAIITRKNVKNYWKRYGVA